MSRVIQGLISIVYNLALLLLLFLGSPWWLFLLLSQSKFREGFGQRFFGVSRQFASQLPAAPRIWIHAVSVGEVLAVSGLARELLTRAPEYTIVVSTTTRTGQQLARERFRAAHFENIRVFYFPFDFAWSVATTLRRIAPSMLILAESELWPNVLTACHRKNIPVVIVNARVSDRSLPRYLKLRSVWRPFLRLISFVFAQTGQDAERLRRIGVPAERVAVGGNLKFDILAPQDVPIKRLLQENLPPATKLLVCGSTLENEESLLLAAWPEILARVPDAIMLLAPRHPERFDSVAELLAASSHAWTRRSQWMKQPTAIRPGSIFLLDSIGELAPLYSLARLAFVGGSLVPAGGHNPLEPAQFGVAINVGPHMENFRAIADVLFENHAMVTVQQAELAVAIAGSLLDEARSAELGANAKRVFEQQAGATARCAAAIVERLRVPKETSRA